MSEPKKSVSKEEMLEAIDEFINKEYPLSCAYSCLPAIRTLILAVGEWQKIATLVLNSEWDKLEQYDCEQAGFDLIRKIRDYGKGEK